MNILYSKIPQLCIYTSNILNMSFNFKSEHLRYKYNYDNSLILKL